MAQCELCGRYRPDADQPHPDGDTCPFHENHEMLRSNSHPDDSLFEAVKRTVPGNSIAIRAWGSSYPKFRTVIETQMTLPQGGTQSSEAKGSVSTDTSYWEKTIWTTAGQSGQYRIEYDPTSPGLVTWYKVEEEKESRPQTEFGAILRKESGDVSYFGSTLPD